MISDPNKHIKNDNILADAAYDGIRKYIGGHKLLQIVRTRMRKK